MAVDPVLDRQIALGRAALELDQPDQAAKQFRQALARARERDDPTAIGDLGFNLAIAQLRARQPEEALGATRDIAAELGRRGAAPPQALRLAEAIALYRIGRAPEADAVAARVEAGDDADAAARSTFLRGLIADGSGDVAGLRAAQARIAVAEGPEHVADATELTARLALRDGDPRRARTAAEKAAEMRRDLLDYGALSRCLALAARAAEQTGDQSAAADLYLRAGRSAAAQGDSATATGWLNRALSLSHDPSLTAAARASISALRAQH